MTTAEGIAVSGVTKDFLSRSGDVVEAVAETTFTVDDHEFVCVVGPSGCGKTTLLRMLAGLARPSSGSISIGGKDPTEAQRDIGLVFQSPVLLPWRTVVDNVSMPALIRRDRSDASRARAADLLELVGLTPFARSYPHELSGGMQQRVSIARALMNDPSVLLMDEPFGALDAMTRQTMNDELRRIWQVNRKTVVLITHDIAEAVFLAERVLVISPRPGRIVDDVRIDLGADRDLDCVSSPEFGELTKKLRHELGLEDARRETDSTGPKGEANHARTAG